MPAPSDDFTFEGGLTTQKGLPSGAQNVLTIFVRASDDTTGNLAALRTSEEAEFTDVGNFYTEASFGQLSFTHTWAPQAGWYQLSRTYDDYMWTQADVNAAPAGSAQRQKAQSSLNTLQDFVGFATEAMQEVVDDGNTISNFDQVVIVVIGGFLRGESAWPYTYELTDANGKSFQVKTTVLVVSTNTGWSRTAHEFGHAFGRFPDSYYSSTRRPGNWDIMDCTDCGAQTPGWNKDVQAGWYKGAHASKLVSVSRPKGLNRKTGKVTLVPYELQNAAAGAQQTLRLDVGGGLHLYVENRQTIAGLTGSQNLPGSGILVTDAMDNVKTLNVKRDPIQLYGGPIASGSTFNDQAYGDLFLAVSGTAPNLTVDYSWGPDPYVDLSIEPWFAPPWETVDIWVDSPVNGWDTYEYHDTTQNPNVRGNPIRNGDRPLVNQGNRLYARISNDGNKDATNVVVSFYVTDPQGIGQEDAAWAFIDRVTMAKVEGGKSAVTPPVIFWPRASSHTCIRVKIDYQSGELNANNNEAFENISDFNTTSTSPWRPIQAQLQVGNPTDRHQDVILEMDGLPDGWQGWVSDRVVDLAPGASKTITYRVNPGTASGMDVGSSVDVDLVGYLKYDKNFMPVGGITSAVHLVKPAQVDIDVASSVSAEALDALRIIVSYAPREGGIPIALVLTEAGTERSGVYSTLTDGSGTLSIDRQQLAAAPDMPDLDAGKTYRLQAYLYGNKRVDSAESAERRLQIVR